MVIAVGKRITLWSSSGPTTNYFKPKRKKNGNKWLALRVNNPVIRYVSYELDDCSLQQLKRESIISGYDFETAKKLLRL